MLIIEDIVDTGRTLRYVMDLLYSRNAKSVKICSFLDKPAGRDVEATADYVALRFQTNLWSDTG